MPLPGEDNPYLRKFGLAPSGLPEPPSPDLGAVVVIPCHDEPDLCGSLDALHRCDPPSGAVEVIVVVNHSESAPEQVRANNIASLAQAESWRRDHETERFRIHLMESFAQPGKRAGVGLARKLGMDEAVRRLERSTIGPQGAIVCFDADCSCDANYLVELERHFATHTETPGCAVRFEHPLAATSSPAHRESIAAYELHLRCYINGLRFAGFPGAYQTVGSSMAVRSWAYQKQGGMNCRQAGEDFYFLQRIIELGNFTELNTTRTLPSPRASHRVPFGTGRAVHESLNRGDSREITYASPGYLDLRTLFQQAATLRRASPNETPRLLKGLSAPMRSFLEQQGFADELEKMRVETQREDTYLRRFFGWFNAFRVMKSLHHCRDHGHGAANLCQTAVELLRLRGWDSEIPVEPDPESLLLIFRELDRAGWSPPAW